MDAPNEESRDQRGRRSKIIRRCGLVGLSVLLLAAGSWATARLVAHEKEDRARDQWQRPAEVIRALDLSDGSVVADVGAGPGYFALKLSSAVGRHGKVMAVDISRRSLVVLWARAMFGNHHNVDYVVGQEDDPRLGTSAVDAVLIAYAYHELTNPAVILEKIREALRPGRRLVVLDLSPATAAAPNREVETQHHELSVSFAESEIRKSGLDVVRVEDRFVDRPHEQAWWLIVARKQ